MTTAISEEAMREVERVLLHLSDARTRARKAVATLERTSTDAATVSALQQTADDLLALDRRLRQATLYATSPSPD